MIVELLAIKIRSDPTIEGIQIDNVVCKLNQYADDTFIVLHNEEYSVTRVLELINEFSIISGLTLNLDKTEVSHVVE